MASWFDDQHLGQAESDTSGSDRLSAITQVIQQTLGRALNQIDPSWVASLSATGKSVDQLRRDLATSDEAKAFAARGPQAAPTPSTGGLSPQDSQWLDQKFQQYGIDPQERPYWTNLIQQHGGVAATGEGWLNDRLMRADSAAGVRSGQVARFNEGAPGTPGNQQFNYPSWNDTFTFDQFQAPTDVTEQNDPGFQERLQLGADALQRSAAARGTVLDTGTLKDLNRYAQDYASNEYQNVYNRAANTYLTQYNSAADQYNKRYQQYLNGYQNALNTFGTNFGVDQNLWNRALTESNTGFQRYLSLADLGLQAAGMGANAGANYGANAGNLYTGIGNANAAGTVASGNAWANGLSNLANYGSGYLYNRQPPRGDGQYPSFFSF